MDPYEAIRQDVEREIAELKSFLAHLKRMQARRATQEGSLKGSAMGVSAARGRLTAADEPWTDAIDRVLRDAESPLTIREMISVFISEGRPVPSGTKGANLLRNYLARERQDRGWEKVGTRHGQALWTTKELAEVQRARGTGNA